MEVWDIYKKFDDLISSMESAGLGGLTIRLKESLVGGSMASEILPLIRDELRKVSKEIPSEQTDILAQIDKLILDIGLVLKIR